MTKEEFITLLQLYGTDITRWPHGTERDAAAHLAAHARDVANEATLDAALDSYRVAPASSALLERIMDAAYAQPASVAHAFHAPRWHMAAMAACAVFGLWCGNASLETHASQSSSWQQPLTALFGATTFSEVAL